MPIPEIRSLDDGFSLLRLSDDEFFGLTEAARRDRSGGRLDLCSIVNARSGGCSEDCSFCAQGRGRKTDAPVYSFLPVETVRSAARSARDAGARRFCIVTSGRGVDGGIRRHVPELLGVVREEKLLPCATLGIADERDLSLLKEAGLVRYHHNLETSESFFPNVCTTHSYAERIRTVEAARAAGLSVCSGGIFGLGESWRDRIEMALLLKRLGVDSVPINFLMPIAGTPLGHLPVPGPDEALRIVGIFRLILPDAEIRVCGGRVSTLGDRTGEIFRAGADGFLIGNYLTTPGRPPEEDRAMIAGLGLSPIP